MTWLTVGMVLPWLIVGLFVGLGCWIGLQLIQQNGRMLGRLESLEQRLVQLAVAPLPVPSSVPAPSPLPAPMPAPRLPAGLPPGSPAPAFELSDLSDGRRSLAEYRGRSLLLVFFNPGCGFCTQMLPDLAALPVDGAHGRPLPVVVTTGSREEIRRFVAEYGLRCPVLLQEAGGNGAGGDLASRYQANGTPTGYLIDAEGRIASELALGAQALLALVDTPNASEAARPVAPSPNGAAALGSKRSLEESKLQRDGLPAGTRAPDFRLPLLHGGELALEEYRGRPVLLVFSDPHCGPCDQLAPQLEKTARREAGVQVLMVSRGELEANQAKAAEHGLTFPVVLQRQWEVSREYGMFATPIAYWIDEEGVIAREVAVGVEPILALLADVTPGGREAAERRCGCGKSAEVRRSRKVQAAAAGAGRR